MVRIFSRVFLLLTFIYALGIIGFITINQQGIVKAATDNSNLVISQIQIAGATVSDEFVELYNPTNSSVNLSGWRLTQKTASSSAQTNLVASLSGTMQPYGYFLIANPASPLATSAADMVYSASSSAITTNNTVLLYSDAGNTLVDKVGFGTASDSETNPFASNPDNNQSIIRKATATSNATSLSSGGSEATFGNGFDTENNATNFVLLTKSMPRNTKSPLAQPPTPTITPTLTASPTATLSPTITPTTTVTPTATPIASPTPTEIPTVTPTTTMTPTSTSGNITEIPTLGITETPTPTPGSEKIIDQPITPDLHLICSQTSHRVKFFGHHFTIALLHFTFIHRSHRFLEKHLRN